MNQEIRNTNLDQAFSRETLLKNEKTKDLNFIRLKPEEIWEKPDYVTLPPEYQSYLSGQEQIPQDDYLFISNLVEKYSITQTDTHTFTRAELFAAAADILNYARKLRFQLDGKMTDPYQSDQRTNEGILGIASDTLDEHSLLQKLRPSNSRIRDICYLFTHIPQVRKTLTHLHSEKMIKALPTFDERLAQNHSEAESMQEYFNDVYKHMTESLIDSVDEDDVNLQNIGIILGYYLQGFPIPKYWQTVQFAAVGTETFIHLLEKVMIDAAENGEDIRTKLREEFLERAGTAHKLMRITSRDLAKYKLDSPPSEDSNLEHVRQIAENNSFYLGTCPAIMPTESSDGIKRPIAYEYAITILNHMPTDLTKIT